MNKLIISLIILSSNVFAQEKLAKDLLEKLSITAQSYDNTSIDFDLIIENKSQKISEKQTGNIVIAEEKFRLTMEDQIVINNGESQWIYLTDLNEVQIINHDDLNDLMSPSNIFNIYNKDYKFEYKGTVSENGIRLHDIDLFPKTSREFIKINIKIDDIKNQLKKVKINDKNGGTISYILNEVTYNNEIKSFVFNISEYTDIEIIDLR